MAAIITHVSDVRTAFGAALLAASLERFGLPLVVYVQRGTLPTPALHAVDQGASPIVDAGPPADLADVLALHRAGLYLDPHLVAVGDLGPTLAVLDARDGFYPWETERSWRITLDDDSGWGRLAGAALSSRLTPRALGWSGAAARDFLRDWRAAWRDTDGDARRGDAVLSALGARSARLMRPGLLAPAMRHWSEIPERANVGPVLVEAQAWADAPAALERAASWGVRRATRYRLEALAALASAGVEPVRAAVAAG